MPDFLLLVKAREPRALVLFAWWFALAGLVPRGWWVGKAVENTVKAVGIIVMNEGDEMTKKAFKSVESILDVFDREGSEAAARSVFDDWENVDWDDGPERARAWETSLLTDWGIDLGPDYQSLLDESLPGSETAQTS
jgi:hypothetical protein